MRTITVKRISFILIYALLFSLLVSCSPIDLFEKTETEHGTQESVSESVSVTEESETELESASEADSEGEEESGTETALQSQSDSESVVESASEDESVSEEESASEGASDTATESASAENSSTEEASDTEECSHTAEVSDTESESISETQSEKIPDQTEQGDADLSSALASLMQDPSPLGGDYAYRYLGTLDGGDAYQALYRALDAAMLDFHKTPAKNASDSIAVTVDFSPLGFTTSDTDIAKVLAVFSALRYDRPIYYWIGSQIGYQGSALKVYVQDAYANGSVRTNTNALLYEAILAYVQAAKGPTAPYEIALAYHDAIVETATYAYLEDGVTPDSSDDSHSVIGIALNGRGVCESYAELYQALLNYRNIPNIMVVGSANGVPHAWNLVQIDGGWYFCDLTWDDTSIYDYGFLPYFCTTDGDRTNLTDVGGAVEVFAHTHSYSLPSMNGTEFFYALPERASEMPQNTEAVTLIGERFTHEDGMTYCVTSSDTVCLVSSNGMADVRIPETVVYEGKSFTVTMVAALDDDGAMTGASVLASESHISLFIPKTVRLIAPGATSGATFYAIEVDSDSPYYEFKDGYLQSKKDS